MNKFRPIIDKVTIRDMWWDIPAHERDKLTHIRTWTEVRRFFKNLTKLEKAMYNIKELNDASDEYNNNNQEIKK